MEKTIDIDFSREAEIILSETDYSKEQVLEFLVEVGGFSVNGSEVVAFLQSKQE